MKEYKVVLSQDLKSLQDQLNNYTQEGWNVLNIKHTVENDTSQDNSDDLYPTDVKTVVTFWRLIEQNEKEV